MMALISVDEVASAAPFALPLSTDAPPGATSTQLVVQKGVDGFIVPVDPIIEGVVEALGVGALPAEISARFHRTLIDLFVAAAREATKRTGLKDVVLGGGVFQNEILLLETDLLLRAEGFSVHRPLLVPANDGAIALGQAAVARARLAEHE